MPQHILSYVINETRSVVKYMQVHKLNESYVNVTQCINFFANKLLIRLQDNVIRKHNHVTKTK